MVDLLFRDRGVAEIIAEGPVDLNVNKTGAHNAVAGVDDFISIHFSRVHSTVKIALGIQNLSISHPEIAKLDLRIKEQMKHPTFPFLKIRPFVIRMMRSFLDVWLKEWIEDWFIKERSFWSSSLISFIQGTTGFIFPSTIVLKNKKI